MEFKELEKIYLRAEEALESELYDNEEHNWSYRSECIFNKHISARVANLFKITMPFLRGIGQVLSDREHVIYFMEGFTEYYEEQKAIFESDKPKKYEVVYSLRNEEIFRQQITCKNLERNSRCDYSIIADGVEIFIIYGSIKSITEL